MSKDTSKQLSLKLVTRKAEKDDLDLRLEREDNEAEYEEFKQREAYRTQEILELTYE